MKPILIILIIGVIVISGCKINEEKTIQQSEQLIETEKDLPLARVEITPLNVVFNDMKLLNNDSYNVLTEYSEKDIQPFSCQNTKMVDKYGNVFYSDECPIPEFLNMYIDLVVRGIRNESTNNYIDTQFGTIRGGVIYALVSNDTFMISGGDVLLFSHNSQLNEIPCPTQIDLKFSPIKCYISFPLKSSDGLNRLLLRTNLPSKETLLTIHIIDRSQWFSERLNESIDVYFDDEGNDLGEQNSVLTIDIKP